MNLTLLFDVDSVRISKVEKISSRLRTTHSFGGSPADHGYSLIGANGRVHMLYRFDQDAALVPTVLSHSRYLPLCYGFYCTDSKSGDMLTAYRVISDETIELLSPESKWKERFAYYDEYPPKFPIERVKLRAVRHNKKNAKDALRYSAVFPLDDLEPSVHKTALELARPQHKELLKYGDTHLGLEDFLSEYSEPFMQGVPNATCIYDGCQAYGDNRMKTIAVVEGHPTENAQLWSLTDNDPYVQLIFRQCMKCETIYATQQAG